MLHWVYPNYCELCGEPSGGALCDSCIAKLPTVPLPICLYCGAPVAGDLQCADRCAQCSTQPRTYDFARSAYVTSRETRLLIHALKYHRANYLVPVMGELLNRLWEDTPALLRTGQYCIVPVPSTPAHLFARGYNQAAELAETLAKLRGLPVCQALRRVPTGADSQTRLSARERQRNALMAYQLREVYASGKEKLPGHDVVLVDDVYTTGSTTRTCAHLLHKLPGVKRVGVLTLLRAVHWRDAL